MAGWTKDDFGIVVTPGDSTPLFLGLVKRNNGNIEALIGRPVGGMTAIAGRSDRTTFVGGSYLSLRDIQDPEYQHVLSRFDRILEIMHSEAPAEVKEYLISRFAEQPARFDLIPLCNHPAKRALKKAEEETKKKVDPQIDFFERTDGSVILQDKTVIGYASSQLGKGISVTILPRFVKSGRNSHGPIGINRATDPWAARNQLVLRNTAAFSKPELT
jgi:hypothetical protein